MYVSLRDIVKVRLRLGLNRDSAAVLKYYIFCGPILRPGASKLLNEWLSEFVFTVTIPICHFHRLSIFETVF